MIPVILESPFAGDITQNERYLRAAIRDCIRRGEAPFASHRMYTSALDDSNPDERALGIAAGFAWRALSARTVVYHDLGISRGMQAGIEHATAQGHRIEYRSLPSFETKPRLDPMTDPPEDTREAFEAVLDAACELECAAYAFNDGVASVELPASVPTYRNTRTPSDDPDVLCAHECSACIARAAAFDFRADHPDS